MILAVSRGCSPRTNADDDDDESFRSRVLRFGLDVAEYREGCRRMQAHLWADTTGQSSSLSMATIRRLVRGLWREATSLLDRAIALNDRIVNGGGTNRGGRFGGLEPFCRHVEYVITKKRRRPSSSRPSLLHLSESSSGGSSNGSNGADPTTEASDAVASGGGSKPREDDDRPPHQRDPPPIDLFDLLWNELRALG
mmetsp:Transcript_1833/g.4766  ORF Transcript_1833/g.4766 Transcript_1833/m.4766 type:complete len:196 (-) Transcript_1833:26-613(-)